MDGKLHRLGNQRTGETGRRERYRKRRRTEEEEESRDSPEEEFGEMRKRQFQNKRVRVRLGQFCYADDTAIVAHPDEHPTANRILHETMRDWAEKLNEGKQEDLWLRPEGRRATDVRRPKEKAETKHVGAWIEVDRRVLYSSLPLTC